MSGDELGKELIRAAKGGDINTVKNIVNKGQICKNKDRSAALVQACKHGFFDCVKFLVGALADLTYVDRDGWSPLLGSCCEGHTDIAMFLLEKDISVEEQYKFGKTALHWAAHWGRMELVLKLLDKGAVLDKRDEDGRTPIMCAVFQDQTAVGQFLIQTGADLSLTEYKNGWTVLHGAARYGRQDMVTYLLEAGCDANARDSKGWTALVYACEHGHTEAVLALMSAGADCNVQTNEGFTALHYTRRADIAGMLLETGADPNIKNRDGNTALHCAAKDGFVEVVRKMVDFGADKNIQNLKGKTAADITTYGKVKEVLSGHTSGGLSPHPPGQAGYIPRFARGTANVAATTATFTAPYKPKQQMGSNADHNASMASMSGGSGSHSPVPAATATVTTPKSTAAPAPTPAVVQTTPKVTAAPAPTAAPVNVVKPTPAPAAAPAPAVAAPVAAPVVKPAPAAVQPVAAPAPVVVHAPAPTPAATPVAVPAPVHQPAPTPVPVPVADNKTLIKEALQGGTKEWRRSKLSIVGEGRAGKTALTNAIVGRGFQETSSTVGINQLTCDVKQVKTTGHGGAETEWGVTSKGGRELETALAQIVAQHKRRSALGHSSAKAASCMDIRTFLKEQDEGKSHRVGKDALQAHLFKHAAAPAVVLSALQAPKVANAVQSGGAWAPKSHATSAAAAVTASAGPVVGAWTPKKKTEYLEYDLSSIGTPVKISTSEPDMSILGQGLRSFSLDSEAAGHKAVPSHYQEPAPVLSEKPDEEMVMKMLATMKDEDTDLLISLFDFGGQSVFDVIHHLFLTRNGVYALVFNMEWLVKDGPEKDKALRFMRNWLSSVAVHTYDKTTNSTAPIVFVGTRLDIVTSPAKHAMISTLLYEQFSDNIAWRSVLENENGHDANGKAFQWFFPVDNKLGKKGPTLKNMMAVVQNAMEGAAYTHKDVPLSWFKVMDQLADAKKDCLLLPDVTAIAARCQVSDAEVPYLLSFLHDMGHLMWIDEPGLRDVVVLDPVSYLVTPATVIICKITPDKDDPTHHFMAAHRECERMHKREWTLLKHDGVLHVSLLPILWKDYAQHKCVLLQLMVKFGLLVPLRAVSSVKNAAAHDTPEVTQYLVPTLLSAAPTEDKNILHWTDAPFSSCYFVFTLSEELSQSTTINAADLRSSGFLPGGMFERIVGKALSWAQDTAKGSGVNLQSVLLYKDMAVLTFGGQRFRLVNCADIHCVRVDVEGSNPLGIQQKLQDFVGKIIDECMKSLRSFPAVLYSSSGSGPSGARDQEDPGEPGDPLGKALRSSELLIPLQQLRAACKGESMLARRGGRELMSIAQIKSTYDQWLQLYELRERYDVFISYRWGQYDSDLTEGLFDMFTNFVVGTDKRAVEVFLDRKRLQDGRRFKMDLAAGLTHSLIALPIVSVDALKRMLEHTTETIDNVLLEWIIILECIAAKRILKVFPVLFGARVLDFRTGGVKVLDFFLDRSKDMLPKIVPSATLEQCRDLLMVNGIQPSARFRTYTVHSVVEEFLQFLLMKASDFDGGRVVEVITDRVMNLLTDCGPEALQLVAGNTASAVLPATSAAPAVAAAVPASVPAPASAAATAPKAGVTKKLEDLSVAEVCALMEHTNGLQRLAAVFLAKEVSGAMLSYCEEIAELQAEEYGVSNAALARGLLKHIKEWAEKGVQC